MNGERLELCRVGVKPAFQATRAAFPVEIRTRFGLFTRNCLDMGCGKPKLGVGFLIFSENAFSGFIWK